MRKILVMFITLTFSQIIMADDNLLHTTIAEPTCKHWLEGRKLNNEVNEKNKTWFEGYVSGVAATMSVDLKMDILKDVDIANAFEFADFLCNLHPDQNLSYVGQKWVYMTMKQKYKEKTGSE